MKLSIIIPAYNEEKRIKKTLEVYYNFFNKNLNKDFEIIVVPNNCTDNTLEICYNFARGKKSIKVLNIPFYIGKGGAVMRGFEQASGKLIGFTDADSSTSPEEFFKLYKNINNYDGIIASRKMKNSLISPRRRLSQNISSFVFNKFVNIFFGLYYKDTQCGAKIFTRDTAIFLVENYTQNHWGFDVDLLYLCKNNNFKILEFPIKWTDSTDSKLTLKASLKTVIDLIKYRFNFYLS